MTTVAHFAVEADQSEFDQVLAEFVGDDFVVVHESDPSATRRLMCELRLSERSVLSRFYRTCTEHGIVLDVQRIYRAPGGASDPGVMAG